MTEPDQLWPEPIDTPGIIPHHLKRSIIVSSPVFEVLQRILYRLHPSTTGDLEKVLAFVGLYQAIRPAYNLLKDFFLWACTVQITVPESDPVAREILAWMGTEVIHKSRTRSAMLVSGGTELLHPGSAPRHMRYLLPPGPTPERVNEGVVCLPPLGTRLFWIGFRPFLFTRTSSQSYSRNLPMSMSALTADQGQFQNGLTITTLGWSIAPLQRFAELCHEFKLKNLTGMTTVYFAGASNDAYGQSWQSVSKAIRKLDSIDMDENIKSDIIRDAEYYYSEQSRLYFADCGIPYRRGYLFHGPPGTGKTSFSAALAGHLKCDIYHINLASGEIGDMGLHRLFLGLPRKCVVVIEDIDSAGIGREQHSKLKVPLRDQFANDEDSLVKSGLPPPPPPFLRNTVTLSGLLNAIDGNATQEGRLLIMTSNNPENLDAALTRPGRVDKKVYFGNMSKSAGRSIFMRLIGRSALTHDATFTMDEIEQYAQAFANKVPANTFTPAQVQNFLQDCRGDPLMALREIDAWVSENKDKSEPANATASSETSVSIVSHAAEMDLTQVESVHDSDGDPS
ncbi:P-loop containing nucleoside triphosphate hydrolase protein [Phaeosphaeriaceae sp. PMI808]|nr:P-loop containing nucleoside triphosphate hydrolase protein [Phaeosphaeriaceae sp. PMI808]